MWGRTRAKHFLPDAGDGADSDRLTPQTLSLWALEPSLGSDPSSVTLSSRYLSRPLQSQRFRSGPAPLMTVCGTF